MAQLRPTYTITSDPAEQQRRAQQQTVATLADLDGELLKAAALRFIENNVYQRIATPGELRQYAAEIVTGAQGLLAPAFARGAWWLVARSLFPCPQCNDRKVIEL